MPYSTLYRHSHAGEILTDEYDVVVACNALALNHLHPIRGVHELLRITRPGGLIVLLMRAYTTSVAEKLYFEQSYAEMARLERERRWSRTWSSLALNLYNFAQPGAFDFLWTSSDDSKASMDHERVPSDSAAQSRAARLQVYRKAQKHALH